MSRIIKSLLKWIKSLISKAPFLEEFLRDLRFRKMLNAPSRETRWGFAFSGSESMALGQYETFETEIILKILNQCELFINVGANVGYYCCLAMQKSVQTIAVEPIQTNL